MLSRLVGTRVSALHCFFKRSNLKSALAVAGREK
jgi:hypothetical protein